MKQAFLDPARRCCDNGRRLLDEAELLEYERPSATRYYLSIIAQEEYAKAFLLYLVAIDAIPWNPLLLRATRNHQCKQLVGIVLDYISPDTDEFLRRIDTWTREKKGFESAWQRRRRHEYSPPRENQKMGIEHVGLGRGS